MGVRDLGSGSPDRALLPSLDEVFDRGLLGGRWGSPRLYGERTDHGPLLARARHQLLLDGIEEAPLTVVAGAMDGIERCLAAYLHPGDKVAVEDPGYTAVIDLLAAMRLVPVPFRVDDDGPEPDSLARALAAGAKAVVVTPRAQNPTGAVIMPERRQDIRALLGQRPDVLLVEDDHAGPIAGGPAGAMSGISGGSPVTRWAMVRSVSKWLGPDLRLAFLTGDATTVGRVEGRRALGPGWVSHVSQRLSLALWELADSPDAGDAGPPRAGSPPPAPRPGSPQAGSAGTTLLQRAAAAYEARRSALLGALGDHGVEAHGRSGLNVWVPVREESSTVQRLLERGWSVRPGERYRLRSGPAIRITTADLSLAEVPRLADDVAASLALQLRAGRTRSA